MIAVPMAEATDSLNQVPLFAGLGRKELKKLGQQMAERTFPEGHKVTEEGNSGIGFFIIEHGSATVSIDGEVVRTLGPGDWFGEIALIDEGKRTATIVAGTDLRCRGMTSWEFRPFVQSHPEVAWPLLQTLAARLRESEARHH
jgi:CRP/FNR family cyclic AMP-dependent transcriptional regulator